MLVLGAVIKSATHKTFNHTTIHTLHGTQKTSAADETKKIHFLSISRKHQASSKLDTVKMKRPKSRFYSNAY